MQDSHTTHCVPNGSHVYQPVQCRVTAAWSGMLRAWNTWGLGLEAQVCCSRSSPTCSAHSPTCCACVKHAQLELTLVLLLAALGRRRRWRCCGCVWVCHRAQLGLMQRHAEACTGTCHTGQVPCACRRITQGRHLDKPITANRACMPYVYATSWCHAPFLSQSLCAGSACNGSTMRRRPVCRPASATGSITGVPLPPFAAPLAPCVRSSTRHSARAWGGHEVVGMATISRLASVAHTRQWRALKAA